MSMIAISGHASTQYKDDMFELFLHEQLNNVFTLSIPFELTVIYRPSSKKEQQNVPLSVIDQPPPQLSEKT